MLSLRPTGWFDRRFRWDVKFWRSTRIQSLPTRSNEDRSSKSRSSWRASSRGVVGDEPVSVGDEAGESPVVVVCPPPLLFFRIGWFFCVESPFFFFFGE